MIVTVEGPSAAGKTTWIYGHFDHAVINDELIIKDAPSSSADLERAAAFWADVSKRRWAAVCAQEADTGMVVCDADPFKLHYAWSLWRIGKIGVERWRAEKSAARNLFANNELGISDLILLNIPNQATLESHAKSDATRLRPNFDLHAQLSEPLREWYKAVELLDPQRVQWQFPDDVSTIKAIGLRETRSGLETFDTIMNNLPVS
jgi:hypothetical protein